MAYYCHVIGTHLDPRFLRYMESHDVASNACRTLVSGEIYRDPAAVASMVKSLEELLPGGAGSHSPSQNSLVSVEKVDRY